MVPKSRSLFLDRGYIGVILGLYWDNGKENGNYWSPSPDPCLSESHRVRGLRVGLSYIPQAIHKPRLV